MDIFNIRHIETRRELSRNVARDCFVIGHTPISCKISCWSIGYFILVYPEVFANVKSAQVPSGSSPNPKSQLVRYPNRETNDKQ